MPTQNTINKPKRQRRSEKLTPGEQKAFKKYVGSCATMDDCADALGLKSRNTVSNILAKGTGHPDTILKIRTALQSAVSH